MPGQEDNGSDRDCTQVPHELHGQIPHELQGVLGLLTHALTVHGARIEQLEAELQAVHAAVADRDTRSLAAVDDAVQADDALHASQTPIAWS
eukprot:6193635-Pleurochrysis_carterae.AAC.1